jgi:hypothetical protein
MNGEQCAIHSTQARLPTDSDARMRALAKAQIRLSSVKARVKDPLFAVSQEFGMRSPFVELLRFADLIRSAKRRILQFDGEEESTTSVVTRILGRRGGQPRATSDRKVGSRRVNNLGFPVMSFTKGRSVFMHLASPMHRLPLPVWTLRVRRTFAVSSGLPQFR